MVEQKRDWLDLLIEKDKQDDIDRMIKKDVEANPTDNLALDIASVAYTNEKWQELRVKKLKELENDKIEFKRCYEDVKEIINYYMDISKENVELVSIWILATYLHKSFNSFPFLFLKEI